MCESHNNSRRVIKLSAMLRKKKCNYHNNISSLSLTVMPVLTTHGGVRGVFSKGGLWQSATECAFPSRPLTHQSEKMRITHIKEGKRQ